MIEIGKVYRTRDGREVRIYAVDGLPTLPVHGAVQHVSGWQSACWSADGISNMRELDLIEVKPKITKTYWLLHWEDPQWHFSIGPTLEYLDTNFRKGGRRAITGPHTVEFTEGQGLLP